MECVSAIQYFWSWFKENEARIFAQCETDAMWQEIDLELGKVYPEIGWEIGPSSEGRMYLAFSPELQESLLPMACAIVAEAYESNLWNFVVGRQRRPWSDVLFVVDEKCTSLGFQLNLEKWRHMVFRVQDSSKFDIVFETGISTALNEDDLSEIGTMLAINLLGETTVMEKVDVIEVVTQLERKFKDKAKPAAWLAYGFGLKPL